MTSADYTISAIIVIVSVIIGITVLFALFLRFCCQVCSQFHFSSRHSPELAVASERISHPPYNPSYDPFSRSIVADEISFNQSPQPSCKEDYSYPLLSINSMAGCTADVYKEPCELKTNLLYSSGSGSIRSSSVCENGKREFSMGTDDRSTSIISTSKILKQKCME